MHSIVMPSILVLFFISLDAMELVDELSGLGEYSTLLEEQTRSLNMLIAESSQSQGLVLVDPQKLKQQLENLHKTYKDAICDKLEWMYSVIHISYTALATAEQERDQLKKEYDQLQQSHTELNGDFEALEDERNLFREACEAARQWRNSSESLLEQRTIEMQRVQKEHALLVHKYIHVEQLYKKMLEERNALHVELHLMKKRNEQVEQHLKTAERRNVQLTQELKEARFLDQQKLDTLKQERRQSLRMKQVRRTLSASTDEIGKKMESSPPLVSQTQSLGDLDKAFKSLEPSNVVHPTALHSSTGVL